jgi:hypothetical protein
MPPRSPSTLRLVAAVAVASALAAAPAADARTLSYRGKTTGGSLVRFKLSGKKITKLVSLVPVICASSTSRRTKAGAELFRPSVSFTLGRTAKKKARTRGVMHYGSVTKYYTVSSERRARRRIAGKLRLSFSFFVPDLYSPQIYICGGSTRFSARPR